MANTPILHPHATGLKLSPGLYLAGYQVAEIKKQYRVMVSTPAYRTMSNDVVKADAKIMNESIDEAQRVNKRIVCNFFSEPEKYHLGCSLYHFPPDEDCYRCCGAAAIPTAIYCPYNPNLCF